MYYTYEWKDGKARLATIEPDVIGELDMQYGYPELVVERLLIDGKDMLQSPSPTVKALALEIKEAIQNDAGWLADLAYQEGYTLETRGGTDPEARWE